MRGDWRTGDIHAVVNSGVGQWLYVKEKNMTSSSVLSHIQSVSLSRENYISFSQFYFYSMSTKHLFFLPITTPSWCLLLILHASAEMRYYNLWHQLLSSSLTISRMALISTNQSTDGSPQSLDISANPWNYISG